MDPQQDTNNLPTPPTDSLQVGQLPQQAPDPAIPVTPAPPKHRRSVIVFIIILLLVIVAASIVMCFLLQPAKLQSNIRPYFSYNQSDIATLRGKSSTSTMSISEIEKWEDVTYELVESHEAVDVDASKIYAYLAVAQMDAAALSFQAHGSFTGSLEPISKDILCQFFPDSCSELLASEDVYSKTLANTVMSQVTARTAEDGAETKPNTLQSGSQYWQGPSPQIGVSASSFKPWFLSEADQFRANPPLDIASSEMQQELVTVKETLAAASNEEKAIVVKWAGGPGTRTPPGIWLTLATDYMKANDMPLDSYLEVRALVTMSMADAVIGVFDSKYAYQYKRPNMVDTSIVTIMPTPNHPSYPAGHATISWAAATVLSAYLPGNKAEWEDLAKEASDSRTIGGIHFPSDNAAGTTLGTNIGNQVLDGWRE